MAKLTELSDAQLDKAYKKYRLQYKEKATPQLKKIILQIDAERKKRQGGGAAKSAPKKKANVDPSPSQTVDLSKLSQSASFLVDKTKKTKESKEKKKFTNKLSKGQAPAIGQRLTNILLIVGGIFGLAGLFLILDIYLLEMLPDFGFKTIIAFLITGIGVGTMKAASHLSDDNR